LLRSFFPVPKLFFGSAVIWTAVAFVIWYTIGDTLQNTLNLADLFLDRPPESPEPGQSVPFFNANRVWTYQYIIMFAALFCVFWAYFNRNIWYWWSVVGSAALVVSTYFNVQLSLFINDWYGSFYNLIQKSVTNPNTVKLSEYYGEMSTLAYGRHAHLLAHYGRLRPQLRAIHHDAHRVHPRPVDLITPS